MVDVSVVIPTFNRHALLGEALESVRRQTVRPREIIVVDDGSSDGTAERLDGDDLVVIRQANRGVAAARNAGVVRASGEWVAFLDSDDVWRPEKLERQLAAVAERPEVDWHYCDSHAVDAAGDPRPPHRKARFDGAVAPQLFEHVFIHTSGVLMRRALFARLGGFREELRNCEDYDLWLRAALDHPVGHLALDLYARRHHDDSLSRTDDPLAQSMKCEVLEAAALRLQERSLLTRGVQRRRLARVHFVAARAHARAGNFREFRRHRARVLQLRPWSLRARLLRNSPPGE